MGWMVAARGRLLIKTDRILVQDGLNGTLLWKRKSPDAVRVNDTLMVGDRVFAIEKNRIVALDAGTGNQIGVFGLPSTYEVSRLHRMAFQDNTLYVPVDQKGLPHKKYDPWLADLLVALDAGDGRLLWAYKAERPFYENSLVLGPQAAYLCSPESGAIGVDLKTGALLWRNPDIKEGVDFRGQYVTIYHDGGVLYLGSQNLAFLDAKTGANRYSIPTPHAKVAFIGNTLYATGGYGSPINSYDILTGEKQPKSLPPSGSWNGCRRMGATSSCLVQQNTFVDLETGQKFYIDMSRTQCGQGVNFANGLAYLSSDPTYCSCDYPMKGMIVMAPAGGWKVPDTQRDLTQCLKKGSAFDSPLTVHADQDDWPSYRHDSCRSACAGGAVKLPSDKGWQKKLSGNLTPISAAGELVFTASSDGHVWALDAGGVVKWTYLCGSGITVTPAYWKGRLFVGSNDGWVYCLDARTGQLAWRFHAAPEDRYVAVDGRLGSTWPVIGGVVVDDDTVYFAAGMCSYDGVYLYAMDAANGRLGWVKEIGHLSETPQNAVCVGANPYGALAIGDDLLYVPTGGSRPIAFNKKDGDLIWWQGNLGGADFDGRTGGAEIVVSGDMLTNGGQRLVGPAYGFRLYHASSGHYYAVCPEATKPGPLPKDTKQLNPFKGDFLGLGTTSPVLTPAVCYTIKREYRQPDKLVAYRRDNLKDVNMAMGADKAKAEAGGILWSTKNVPAGAHSIVVAGSQILVAGTSEVVVLDETGQKELARFKVESKILPNGLAVAKGKAYVVTEEGSAFCLGRALLEP
jgi:outer membrane protein assembly factor BamB